MSKRGENIYKRRDGRWEGRILKAEGGYAYVYGKNYREVKEKKAFFYKTRYRALMRETIKKRFRQVNGLSSGFKNRHPG